MKVWQAYVNQLLKSSEVSDVPVSLLKEVIFLKFCYTYLFDCFQKDLTAYSLLFSILSCDQMSTIDSSPASVISFTVPIESTGKLFLAIGRGSGSLEVWIGELKSSNFDKACCPDAHEHIVSLCEFFNTSTNYGS